jgi:hypothetical protein
MTDLAGKQLNSGDSEQASETLELVQRNAENRSGDTTAVEALEASRSVYDDTHRSR